MRQSHSSRMPYGINVVNRRNLLLRIQTNDRFGRFVYHLFVAWSCGHQKQVVHKRRLQSVGLASRVNLGAEIGSSGSRLGEVAREDGLDEGAEDDLGTTARCQYLNRSVLAVSTYEVWGRAIHRMRTNLKV